MASVAASLKDRGDSPDFAKLLAESLGEKASFEGSVVKGRIVGIAEDFVMVDVGLKSEGRISLREFSMPGQDPEVRVGDLVDVYVEKIENRSGDAVISREKARREEVWGVLEQHHLQGKRTTGVIFGRVKGGFTVDLGGAIAFLPGSQVDIRPVRDVSPLMGTPQPFMILKMDRARGNIVVSRRAVLEESREEARSDLLGTLREGQVLQGTVKNITDYGAFIDLGGVDGLLHVTDISWKRVNNPGEVLTIGQAVQVQVIRYNTENGRISLGMKQLESDPWKGIAERYTAGTRISGKVTNLTDYGAFIELETGVEGLVHVSEMSWTKKNVHPNKILTSGDTIDVMVLDVDMEKRRISLGLKQLQDNPWAKFAQKFQIGQDVSGEIRNITEFGLFVGLDGDIDGMVHMSDLSWDQAGEDAIKSYNKGDTVTVRILDIDAEKERVSLGVKQLTKDPFDGAIEGISKGAVVTGTVTAISDKGIDVSVGEGLVGFIKKADLSRERSEQRSDRFAVGEKVDAKVVSIDPKTRKLQLSIKQREIEEDKAAMAAFGSTESGASLGDILGAALQKTGATEEEAPVKTKATSKKKKDETEE